MKRTSTLLAVAALALAPAAARADVAPPGFSLASQNTWTGAQALLGGDAYTPPVVEGGWSAFAPIDDNTYWTISDRGPNGQPTVGGAARRTFLAPGFTPTIYKVQVGNGALTVLQRIPLHLKAGATDPARAAVGGNANEITGLSEISTAGQLAASGLPSAAAGDEIPYAADGTTVLTNDPYGEDTESIAVDPRDGSFWIGDEYRPALVHVAADGTVLNRIIPKGVTIPGADNAVVNTQPLLPQAFEWRKQNRGMEGGTLTKDGRTLFGMLQSPIVPPAGAGDNRTLRLVRFDVSDPANPVLTGEFVYRLQTPDAGTGLKQTDISISDIYALDATHLLVDEHDNVTDVAGQGQKRIYEADLTNATNILGTDDGANPTLEAGNAAGVTPAAKTLWLDLVKYGYDHDKPEGIGIFPDGDLAVQDDNDFGFNQGNDPNVLRPGDPPFKVSASGHTTQLWRFDASNVGDGGVSGTVPATLSLSLGGAPAFAAFIPGVAGDYTASATATVVSSAADATLTISDPSATATGHLVNGAFALPSPLQWPTPVKTWSAPVSNDVVTIPFTQHIGANDALRTGTYAKTLTFTLSTTTP